MLGVFSALYRLGLFGHQSLYRYLKKPGRLKAPVISIGNITLGGTGKTPAVIGLARESIKYGFSPCVLTRGYRGRTGDICFVSKGDSPLLDPSEAGDEAYLMAISLKGIPIIKGRQRYNAGVFALLQLKETYTSSDSRPVFILDDGFQHWGLERDINIVLIDATNPFGNGRLVPEGILREPLSALSRADIIVLSKSDMVDESSIASIISRMKNYNTKADLFRASHRAQALVHLSGKMRELSFLFKNNVYAFAGIANASYFESLLSACGAQIRESRRFRDHHTYTQKDIDTIRDSADGLDIITTEKDLVKLKALNVPANLYALRIEFSIDPLFYQTIFRRLE